MKKLALTALVVLVVMGGSGVFGQSATKSVDITVTLTNWYYLSLGIATLTFNDAAPTFQASPPTANLAATENAVSITAGAIMKSTQTLKVYISAPDLASAGLPSIGIGAITWTATNDFKAGTMANANGPTCEAGSWTGSIYHWKTGTLNFFFLRNYQTQSPGAYTSTATVTVSLP